MTTPLPTPSGKFVPCPRHPSQPAGRCPDCYREAAPCPPAEIEEAKAKLRQAARYRPGADERRRRAEFVASLPPTPE